ncbi:hypothetical protein CON84_18660 [Bacillus sp. AFS094228]|uniref:hypothetical protein n=1 Tax=Peribacillus frigoritolerans TaxID=450367 RepID=UPI000BEC378D|nr:hypothetical protein CON84_18660 [Bacillus sp. AFS094228]
MDSKIYCQATLEGIDKWIFKRKGRLFAISPELKKEAKKILFESFDMRTETLFPDFDGFASLVNNINSDMELNHRW